MKDVLRNDMVRCGLDDRVGDVLPRVEQSPHGFALAVSLALAGAAKHGRSRALALAWAPTIFLAVLATGNHYLFDIVAGVAATGAGYAFARQLPRTSLPALRPAQAHAHG